MQHPERHLRLRRRSSGWLALAGAAAAVVAVVAGCQNKVEAPKPVINYADLGAKPNVPEFMKGTVWELTNRTNDEPYPISSYGLVSGLRGTGDSTTSLQVRQWMHKQMARHGVGSTRLPGYGDTGAEAILRDPGYAIVRVDGLLPPGAREGDFMDVRVSALPGNKTTSLSGGVLFSTELYRIRGNSPDLNGVQILARAAGPVVVNPAHALADVDAPGAAGQAKASLRSGSIMDGGVVVGDRALLLRMRHPSRQIARAIENRINQRFQKEADRARKDVMPITYKVAFALDEGMIEVYVPRSRRGNWEHFMGVIDQLPLNGSPAALVARAQRLTDEAVKPGAPLMEISYALEAIGEPAMQYVTPLMAHPNADVSFAAARAAVFIDPSSAAAQESLLRIARNDAHPFQVVAVQALGALAPSPERNQKVRTVLASKNTRARTEAYKVLARNKDSALYSRVIKEKFALDVLPGEGEPVVYASRTGIPRIALIGPKAKLDLPILFTTMGNRLMISSGDGGRNVTIFFRDERRKEPIKMLSRPDLAEIVARLGGEGSPEEERFDFTYGEVVAVVQELANQQKVVAARPDGRVAVAPFVFEAPRDSQDLIDTAPVIEDSRPNTAASKVEGGRMKDEADPAAG